ncbi:MAG: hypothetical protein EXQ99_01990 [Alphaproteobacteria bacterium]|nr:hypothetical protein [Alphaproteobacteria bacterium]
MLAALPARAEPDETGFFGIRLGTPLEDVLATQPTAHIWQETKTELAGCYFQYSIPTILGDAEAEAWLCEARDHPDKLVMEISVEARSNKESYLKLVEALTARFGLPTLFWGQCLNAEGAPTEQYSWYLKSSMVRLLNRDVTASWLVLRIDPAGPILDYGPGLCQVPPLKLNELGRPSIE